MLKFIRNDSTNPYFNLALEEYVLKNVEPGFEFFMLWRNCPSIIVGRYQNTVEEINSKFVQENNINVVRRISGGGAVYHDLGNINFTFIDPYEKRDSLNFKKYTLPIINSLKEIGITAELNGRNDITIQGKKFSGNSQHIYKSRLLHHGTLLFNSDLSVVGKALNVSKDKFISKGIKSVRSRVTNISDYLKEEITIDEFKSLLLKNLSKSIDYQAEEYELTQEDKNNINNLMIEKYSTWEWNYGQSPKFNFKNSKKLTLGKIEVLMDIDNGIINQCRFYGDFLGTMDIEDVEKKLKGKKYKKDEINSVLTNICTNEYFGGITKNEIMSCMFD